MSDKLEKDPQAVVFYLYKTIEDMKGSIDTMRAELQEIKLELTRIDQQSPQSKLKANATSGGAGAAITAVLIGIWEYLKN